MLQWVTREQVDAGVDSVMSKNRLIKLEEITAIMEKKLKMLYFIRALTMFVPPAMYCCIASLPIILSCSIAGVWYIISWILFGLCIINPRLLQAYQVVLSKQTVGGCRVQ